jgi:hypothetical protein
MDDRLDHLPESARRLVASIQRALAEAQPLLSAPDAPPDLAFTLRETAGRYLPDTIDAYLAIPPSRRDAAEQLLLEQLSVLDRSARKALDDLSAQTTGALAANARFLAERFDDRSTAIEAGTDAPLSTVWFGGNDRSPQQIVAHAADALGAALPALTKVTRGGVFGMGAVQAVDITLPQGGGTAFRYTVALRDGALEATVAKLVHGTVIQRVVCSPGEWLQSLHDDVAEHARRHQEMRGAFAALFSEMRNNS